MHHTKLQINGPSGQCSHLDFHPDLFYKKLSMNHQFTPSEEAVPNTIQSILIVNSI